MTSPSQKVYIGITTRTLRQRINDHVAESKRKNRKIHKALRKYPIHDWCVEIIDTASTIEELKEKEIVYIQQHNSVNEGYNLSTGGEASKGAKRSKETCEKISNSKKGYKHTQEWKDHHRKVMTGKKQSESQKKKVAEALSQKFLITCPDGREMEIINLRRWCMENGLDQGNMTKVSQGKSKHHKNYKCRKI